MIEGLTIVELKNGKAVLDYFGNTITVHCGNNDDYLSRIVESITAEDLDRFRYNKNLYRKSKLKAQVLLAKISRKVNK